MSLEQVLLQSDLLCERVLQHGLRRLFLAICSNRPQKQRGFCTSMDDKRMLLLKSAVRAVSKFGMKDASTRCISNEAGVNDAYIYRFFQDKEDLLKQAFLLENDKCARCVLRHIDLARDQLNSLSLIERCRHVFHMLWRYLLDNPDVCRFCMYYYYSPSFERYTQDTYREHLGSLARSIQPIFNNILDVKQCMCALFVLLNSSAFHVLNGVLPDDNNTEERTFKMVLNAICFQMKQEVSENVNS